jgi:site-specific recombinase XerD
MRNRVMLAFAYDAALRREELCLLETGDIGPSARLLRIRAETTKGRRERVVPYSAATDGLYAAYLRQRRTLSRARGPLFLSESPRNHGEGISPWTWSKVVQRIATRAGVQRLSTHTFRHLCLTDLARSGWDLHEIAQFAGHRNTQTTLQYVHLSGRELSRKLERGMAAIHSWRTAMAAEMLA